MIRKHATNFSKFINDTFVTATNAARALGCTKAAIYNNCRNPTGGYVIVDRLYGEILELRQENKELKENYNSLVQRYNELVESVNNVDKIEEYLGR